MDWLLYHVDPDLWVSQSDMRCCWFTRVKDYCIQHGYEWGDSAASTSCGEQEYYEDLLLYYKQHERVSYATSHKCLPLN